MGIQGLVLSSLDSRFRGNDVALCRFMPQLIINQALCLAVKLWILKYIHSMRPNMKASILDLRYKMRAVIKALDRNEKVIVLYHGKEKAVLTPIRKQQKPKIKVEEHPFFGMLKEDQKSVNDIMDELRGTRYSDI